MRVKTGFTTRRKHKKLLKKAKGYRQQRSKIYKRAKEAFLHAGQYSMAHRRKRVGQMRSLWILRLNAALAPHEISYSKFIGKLNKSDVKLNRKMLSELALKNPEVFTKVVKQVLA